MGYCYCCGSTLRNSSLARLFCATGRVSCDKPIRTLNKSGSKHQDLIQRTLGLERPNQSNFVDVQAFSNEFNRKVLTTKCRRIAHHVIQRLFHVWSDVAQNPTTTPRRVSRSLASPLLFSSVLLKLARELLEAWPRSSGDSSKRRRGTWKIHS